MTIEKLYVTLYIQLNQVCNFSEGLSYEIYSIFIVPKEKFFLWRKKYERISNPI